MGARGGGGGRGEEQTGLEGEGLFAQGGRDGTDFLFVRLAGLLLLLLLLLLLVILVTFRGEPLGERRAAAASCSSRRRVV